MSSTGLKGHGVIVTGAGSGIGRATALALAREGARVLVADLGRDGAEQVVAAIGRDRRQDRHGRGAGRRHPLPRLRGREFLASEAASNVNGVILPVDNGWSAV